MTDPTPTPTPAEVDTVMEKMGSDGLLRPTDEHYDTVMDVQEDPTGALWSIHALFDRCEALRKRAEEAERERDGAIQWRNHYRQSWLDCRDALTTARSAEAAAWNDAIEAAAGWMQKRLDDYISECGSYDGTTGVTEFPGNGDEWVCEQEEAIEDIRALRRAAPTEDRT